MIYQNGSNNMFLTTDIKKLEWTCKKRDWINQKTTLYVSGPVELAVRPSKAVNESSATQTSHLAWHII